MLKNIITYVFTTNLMKEDGTTFEVNFKVLGSAEDGIHGSGKAKEKLLKYLSNPKQTGYIYKECVGVREMPCDYVIVDS